MWKTKQTGNENTEGNARTSGQKGSREQRLGHQNGCFISPLCYAYEIPSTPKVDERVQRARGTKEGIRGKALCRQKEGE